MPLLASETQNGGTYITSAFDFSGQGIAQDALTPSGLDWWIEDESYNYALTDIYRYKNTDGFYAYSTSPYKIRGGKDFERDTFFSSNFQAYDEDIDGSGSEIAPVYELRHRNKQWIYTTQTSIVDSLTGQGYRNSGVAFYAQTKPEKELSIDFINTKLFDGNSDAVMVFGLDIPDLPLEISKQMIDSSELELNASALFLTNNGDKLKEVDLRIQRSVPENWLPKGTREYDFYASSGFNGFLIESADLSIDDYISNLVFQVTQRIERRGSKTIGGTNQLVWADYAGGVASFDNSSNIYPFISDDPADISDIYLFDDQDVEIFDSYLSQVRSNSVFSATGYQANDTFYNQNWGNKNSKRLNIIGIDLEGYSLTGRPVSFQNVDGSYAKFQNADYQSSLDRGFDNAIFTGGKFGKSSLSKVSESNFDNANLSYTKLNSVYKTSFVGSRLTRSSLSDIRESNFEDVEADSSFWRDFSDVNLVHADITNARALIYQNNDNLANTQLSDTEGFLAGTPGSPYGSSLLVESKTDIPYLVLTSSNQFGTNINLLTGSESLGITNKSISSSGYTSDIPFYYKIGTEIEAFILSSWPKLGLEIANYFLETDFKDDPEGITREVLKLALEFVNSGAYKSINVDVNAMAWNLVDLINAYLNNKTIENYTPTFFGVFNDSRDWFNEEIYINFELQGEAYNTQGRWYDNFYYQELNNGKATPEGGYQWKIEIH